ncbi:threonine dehydrogenase-like Zn-dependent dehydrogenase [Sagittula marina]|uniref:Threonine dehydrogenase-like Zn-dependent dehydrogenase n=2 Tax=Sagittula marina TaxID=943940 RepID=A0A7W6DS07_9RHOB|nr:threonine dehydrogenase-like Zn-dependent dehydrogenase [Sagittula marina]
MRFAEFKGDNVIEIGTRERPTKASGEVILRVTRTALCGSDLKLWHKGAQHVAGHEICGVVRQPGHPLEGQHCAVYIPEHCGTCETCAAGNTQMCTEVSSLVGWNRDGGYAEWVRVPENCLLPVPDDIPVDLAPLLLDTIGTSAHAVREAKRHLATDTPKILITGAGPVGLGVLLALKAMGFSGVHVSDPNAARLDLAQEFGATPHFVGSREKRFDLIVECSGAHPARDIAIDLILPKGVIVLVGENAAPWTIHEGPVFRRKDFILLRTFYFPKGDFEPNVALLRANLDAYARLVDDRFGLDALPEKFAQFARGGLIKPVLVLDEEDR